MSSRIVKLIYQDDFDNWVLAQSLFRCRCDQAKNEILYYSGIISFQKLEKLDNSNEITEVTIGILPETGKLILNEKIYSTNVTKIRSYIDLKKLNILATDAINIAEENKG